MSKLTPEAVREIADRRERGWSYARLARHYGVSPGAIHYQCLRQGARSPKSRIQPYVPRPPIVAGDGRVQRRFTPEEDARLQRLAQSDWPVARIAREMDRPITSVRIRLMTLALHEEAA